MPIDEGTSKCAGLHYRAAEERKAPAGVTYDLARPGASAHGKGPVEGFTKGRGMRMLFTVSGAIRWEEQLKRWNRKWNLIEPDEPFRPGIFEGAAR